jgi:hypothetical protein
MVQNAGDFIALSMLETHSRLWCSTLEQLEAAKLLVQHKTNICHIRLATIDRCFSDISSGLRAIAMIVADTEEIRSKVTLLCMEQHHLLQRTAP